MLQLVYSVASMQLVSNPAGSTTQRRERTQRRTNTTPFRTAVRGTELRSMRLTGEVTLVTVAKGIVERFASEGARVAFTGRDAATGARVEQRIRNASDKRGS